MATRINHICGRKQTALLVAALIFSVTSQAFDVMSIDSVISAVYSCRANNNPAFAVAVVKDGATLLSKGYGITHLHGNQTVSGSTRFGVASLTKAFTATLLMTVMEKDGRYNLSTKILDILGRDFRFMDDVRTMETTVEDILSHKMAIPSHNFLRFDNNLTRTNLPKRLRSLKAPAAFRSEYIYNSLMYGLATHLIETIAKESYENLVRRYLFQPLDMRNSTFAKELDFDNPETAQPVIFYEGNLKPICRQLPSLWGELTGSGSIISTADDMVKWMNLNLYKGKAGPGGKSMVPVAIMAELFKPRTAFRSSPLSKFRQPVVPVTFTFDTYGLGWRQGYYRGYPVLGHSGSTFGYQSLLTLMPSKKLGVFTALSGPDPYAALRGVLHAFLLDNALGVSPWLNQSTLCTFPAPWHNVTDPFPRRPTGTKRPLAYNISAYLGIYENAAYGRVEVSRWRDTESEVDDGHDLEAHLTMFYGFGTWDLVQLPPSSTEIDSITTLNQPEYFYGKGRNITAWVDYSPLVFHPLKAGKTAVMELSIPGFEALSPPVFTRVGWSTSGSQFTLVSFMFYRLLLLGLMAVVKFIAMECN